VHAVQTHEVATVGEMTDYACEIALREGFATQGQTVVISAGLPFASSGTTNILRIATVGEAAR
jgi:pyruvate kinase